MHLNDLSSILEKYRSLLISRNPGQTDDNGLLPQLMMINYIHGANT